MAGETLSTGQPCEARSQAGPAKGPQGAGTGVELAARGTASIQTPRVPLRLVGEL